MVHCCWSLGVVALSRASSFAINSRGRERETEEQSGIEIGENIEDRVQRERENEMGEMGRRKKEKKKRSWNAESSQGKQQNSICTLQLENWPGRRRVLITSVETRETRRRCRRVLEDYSNDVYAHSPRRFASCLVPSPSGFQPRREKRGGRL